MSLSNPTLTNPAQHFFQWGGSTGQLTWWDKENQRNVQVKLPFEFIVLDQLSTITGYSKNDESGFWSNEVRSTITDELFVRTKKGPFEAGLYSNLTQTMKRGGKFAKSIYVAHQINGEWVIGNIKASGSALSAWIEFTKHHNVEKGKIVMNRGEAQDAPTGQFFPPVFSQKPWEIKEYEVAVNLDKELQIYLSKYLTAPKVDDDAHGLSATELATPEQQADFEDRKATMHKPNPDDVTIEDFDNEPINLDDIPF